MPVSLSTPPILPDAGQWRPAWPLAAWQWLTAPSPHLVKPDERRQAQLLSAILVITIPLLVLTEIAVLALLGRAVFGGSLLMLGVSAVLLVAYGLSRTVHYERAALLTNVTASAGILAYAVGIPGAVSVGILSWLLIPLLLAGTFLPIWQLLLLWLASLAGLLLFPILSPVVTFVQVAVNSLPFVIMSGAVVLVLTRHRDQLEQDRSASIRRAELRARQDAARTAALLRIVGRLNSLLDLEMVLAIMCEEIALALEAQTVLVFLYDDAQTVLSPAASHGWPTGLAMPTAIPRAIHDEVMDALGSVATIPSGLTLAGFPSTELIVRPAAGSLAYANLAYNGRLVGSLLIIGPTSSHPLTDDERLLLRGLADQAALAIVNTRLYKDARRRLEHLQALRAIDVAITSNRDLQRRWRCCWSRSPATWG